MAVFILSLFIGCPPVFAPPPAPERAEDVVSSFMALFDIDDMQGLQVNDAMLAV